MTDSTLRSTSRLCTNRRETAHEPENQAAHIGIRAQAWVGKSWSY